MPKRSSDASGPEMSAVVQYICRMAFYTATAFLVLALAALAFMSPGAVSRGIYYVVIALNTAVVIGALLLKRFMRKSDDKLARALEARKRENGKTLDDWLSEHDGAAQETAKNEPSKQ